MYDSVASGIIHLYICIYIQYGVPLDDRADFTKTDWEMWVAAMEDDSVVCSVIDNTSYVTMDHNLIIYTLT